MRTTLLIISAALLSGCTTIGSERLYQVETRYRSVHTGMARNQVVAALGKPSYVDRGGNVHWKYDRPIGNESRYVDLSVRFDPAAIVMNTTVTSGTDRYPSVNDSTPGPIPIPSRDWQPIAGRSD
jgi:outer membrane protein assembly factor BamE (lipoprotein component of BamABCDE complex)